MIITNQYIRQRVNVEERSKIRQIIRVRQISYTINEHFRATGAHEAARVLSDLFNVSLQGDDIQDFVS